MEEELDYFYEEEMKYIEKETGLDREIIEIVVLADNKFLSEYVEKNNIEVEEI